MGYESTVVETENKHILLYIIMLINNFFLHF